MLSTVVWCILHKHVLPVQNSGHVTRHVYAAIHAVFKQTVINCSKKISTLQQLSSRWQSRSQERVLFLGAQGFLQASVGLDPDQEEAGGGRKKDGLTGLRGHHSVLAQDQSIWPQGHPGAFPPQEQLYSWMRLG